MRKRFKIFLLLVAIVLVYGIIVSFTTFKQDPSDTFRPDSSIVGETMIDIQDPLEQQCDSNENFQMFIGNMDYETLLKSGLEKVCPNRYYILIHSEMGAWILSTLNEPGTLRVNQTGEKEVYAQNFSCVNHICAHEDICATPRWEKYTGNTWWIFGYPKKYYKRIEKFRASCFW